jgi:hypothetical protein
LDMMAYREVKKSVVYERKSVNYRDVR